MIRVFWKLTQERQAVFGLDDTIISCSLLPQCRVRRFAKDGQTENHTKADAEIREPCFSTIKMILLLKHVGECREQQVKVGKHNRNIQGQQEHNG